MITKIINCSIYKLKNGNIYDKMGSKVRDAKLQRNHLIIRSFLSKDLLEEGDKA